MLNIEIPGFRSLHLEYLVLDFNGTLALDGRLPDDAATRIEALATTLAIHVVTGYTYGSAQAQLQSLPLTLTILDPERQAEAKWAHVRCLGPDRCACIGNGRNDRWMLQEAALGIAVAGAEGAAIEALTAADLYVPHILDALDLLRTPRRLVATLRG